MSWLRISVPDAEAQYIYPVSVLGSLRFCQLQMSAYILLASRQTADLSLQKQKKKGRASLRSSQGSRTTSNSRASVSSSKKRYDLNTNSYVDVRSLSVSLQYGEQQAYQREKDKLARSPTYNINFYMNQERVGDQKLFSSQNLDMLRYTYFEKLVPDNARVDISTRLPYMKELASIREAAAQKGKHTTSEPIEHKSGSVQGILLSNQFWNNVYQDIKFESADAINYFDLMPNISHCQSFFIQVIDYALYHLTILAPPESLPHQSLFVHFADSDYAWIRNMGKMHVQQFATQYKMCSYFSQPSTKAENKPVDLHAKLMSVLVLKMTENIQQMSTLSNKDNMVRLWKHFLSFVTMQLIFTPDNRDRMNKLLSPTPARTLENYQFPSPNLDSCLQFRTHSSYESESSKITAPASIMSTNNSKLIGSPTSEPEEVPEKVAGPPKRLLLRFFKK